MQAICHKVGIIMIILDKNEKQLVAKNKMVLVKFLPSQVLGNLTS